MTVEFTDREWQMIEKAANHELMWRDLFVRWAAVLKAKQLIEMEKASEVHRE